MDSRYLYLALIGAVAGERLVELVLSERHRRRALARGGVESGQGHYPWMVLVHTLFLIAAPAEVFLLDRPAIPALAIPMLLLVLATMGLRYWAVVTLGEHWNTRVVVVPGMTAVARGPYRFLRHPNYVAVTVEIAALALVHTAWLTALIFSLANAILLRVRIAAEERALAAHAQYEAVLGARPRFVPSWRRWRRESRGTAP